MIVRPTQVTVEHGGEKFAGIYSVSGKTLIARVTGINSRTAQIDENDDHKAVATQLVKEIVEAAYPDKQAS